MMNIFHISRLTILALALSLPGVVHGGPVVVYSTGFERPDYTTSALVGQDGWYLSPAFGAASGPAASVVPPGGFLSSQALQVTGALLQPELDTDPYYYLGLYRRDLGYNAGANGTSIISVRVDARLDGPTALQTGRPGDREEGDAYTANLAAVARTVNGDRAFGEISLSSDGHVYGYGYTGTGGYLFGARASLGVFHELGLDINLANSTTTYLLDGAIIGVDSFAGVFSSQYLARVVLLNYGNLAVPLPNASFDRDNFVSYFDNLSVTAAAVPEPSSLSLLGLGAMTMLGAAIRRKRMRTRAG